MKPYLLATPSILVGIPPLSIQPVLPHQNFGGKQQNNTISRVCKGKKLSTSPENGFDTVIKPLLYDKNMLEGRCPKCGAYSVGWALRHARHQMCDKCGVPLEITLNGKRVFTGYSPFTAKHYFLSPPANAPSTDDKDKNRPAQKD